MNISTFLQERACAALALISVSLLTACASPGADHVAGAPFDPYEERNRQIHAFNKSVDRNLYRPAGKGYSDFLPDDPETAIGRFAFNLAIPSDIVNNILQLNMRGAFQDTGRFLVNSTVGLAGFFDPATELNMAQPTNTNFGETLHVWGVKQGAYVELPFLGPSTERDTAGMIVDIFTNPITYLLAYPNNLYGTGAALSANVARRGRYADAIDSILYESADSYAASRSLYLQNRQYTLGQEGEGAYLDPYDDPYGSPSGDPYGDPYSDSEVSEDTNE
ncbi:VacJ family lipoprotein [Roseovarius sp. EL26]|uniref:MlaA family lipoprotein n=1 Tax=Roseovarius sp. EL26 TaxID=2126672 RepID=UPI000EA20BD9|nr:VacJ family lipoprotein [Roseovarius sp. EL26]